MTKKSPETIAVWRKYATPKGFIPQLSYLSPTGKEIIKLRHIGNLPAEKLAQKLEELRTSIFWLSKTEEAIKIAKRHVRPVAILSIFDHHDESETLLIEFDNIKSYSAFADKFIWVKQSRSKDTDGQRVPSIRVIDPYKEDTPTNLLLISADKDTALIKSFLTKQIADFNKLYIAPATEFKCEKCGKTESISIGIIGGKECCGRLMKHIKTFRCKKCDGASANEGSCCGEERVPETEDRNSGN